MKIERIILATLFVIGFSGLTSAQDNQPNECTRFKAIAGNAYQAREYEKTTQYYMKALNECDQLELKFYNPFIYAVQMSSRNAAGDSVAEAAYLDTLIMVYEAGQKAHGIQKDWQTHLGYYYLQQGEPKGMQKADEAFRIGVHYLAEKVSRSFLQQYYVNLYNLWVQEQDEAVKGEYKQRIISEYFKLSDYANKGEMGPEVITFLSNVIDNAVTDCASLLPEINTFMQDLPQEVEAKKATIKNFMTLLENKECTKSKEYAMLVDTIIAIDPSVDAVLAKAKLQLSQGSTSAAITTFREALAMVDDADSKSDIELSIANAYYRSGSYRSAHNSGIAVTGKNSARGYEIAARSVNAMMNDCGVSTFDRKANNYYALELAERSGNASLISSMKSQCPSSSDIFNADQSVGNTIVLECWNKTYTIKTY